MNKKVKPCKHTDECNNCMVFIDEIDMRNTKCNPIKLKYCKFRSD